MSAFMVADTTINNVVNWLRREIDRFSFTVIPHELKELGFGTTVPGWAENLGQTMFQLNIVAAVCRQYGV